jgi:hypothetical protein
MLIVSMTLWLSSRGSLTRGFSANFDSDDPFHASGDGRVSRNGSVSGSGDEDANNRPPKWSNQPTMYAYDALAERSKEREAEVRKAVAAT